MMNLENRIASLCLLGKSMDPELPEVQEVAERAFFNNRWFTREHIYLMLESIRHQFLQEEKLHQWLAGYTIKDEQPAKNIGLIMAGNIPLVGFHDLLCVLLSGHKALIKLSSKDNILLPWLLEKLFLADEKWRSRVAVAELLNGMDAAIATGSNNSARYFHYYFDKYPHIIRKNRGSVAVLKGNESTADLLQLGIDIFTYFGLGCRNVSKLLVPEGYSFNHFFESIAPFHKVIEHNKYKNNFDYNLTLLMMNKEPHYNNDFLMLKEDSRMVSPVAILHYEYYQSETDLTDKLEKQKDEIQVIAGENFIPFGKTQTPELWDYADKVDTMEFLVKL